METMSSWHGTDGLAAWDAKTGSPLWEFDVARHGFATPNYVVLERVVVVSRDGRLYGVRADDGGQLWSNDEAPSEWTDDGYPTGPITSDGQAAVYVANRHELARVDPLSGEIEWSTVPDGAGSVRLTAGSGIVCTARSPIVTVACYTGSNGAFLWSDIGLTEDSAGGIATVGQRVIVLTGGDLWGLDVSTGERVWIRPSPGSFDQAGDNLYGCNFDDESHCVAVRATDGMELWRVDVPPPESPPLATADFVFVPVLERPGGPELSLPLYILDSTTGQIAGRLESPPNNPFRGRPAYADGRLFIETDLDIRAYRYP